LVLQEIITSILLVTNVIFNPPIHIPHHPASQQACSLPFIHSSVPYSLLTFTNHHLFMDSYLSNSSLVHSIPKSNSWIYSTKLQILVIRSNFKIDIEPFQHQLLVLVFLLMTPCLPLTWHSRKCLKILVQNTSYVTHHIIIVPLSTMKISKILYSLITQCDYTTSINTMHLTSLVSTDSQIKKLTFPSKYTFNSLLPSSTTNVLRHLP
jgi:hypothetical protein